MQLSAYVWAYTYCSTALHNTNPDIWHLKIAENWLIPATPALWNFHTYLGFSTFLSEIGTRTELADGSTGNNLIRMAE